MEELVRVKVVALPVEIPVAGLIPVTTLALVPDAALMVPK
jgi:hypothetical protein